MKAEDLRIGDWVICNYYTDKPFYHQFGLGDFMKCGHEFCEPIPLTPEILEKNGFKFFTDLWYLQTDEHKPIQICFKDGKITMSINCTPVPIELKHVHQLQHALKLYGIKKEITL